MVSILKNRFPARRSRHFLKLAVDLNAPAAVKTRAAYYILTPGSKAMETEDIDVQRAQRLLESNRDRLTVDSGLIRARGSKEFDPFSRFPRGKSRGGDGGPHARELRPLAQSAGVDLTRCAPPPGRSSGELMMRGKITVEVPRCRAEFDRLWRSGLPPISRHISRPCCWHGLFGAIWMGIRAFCGSEARAARLCWWECLTT